MLPYYRRPLFFEYSIDLRTIGSYNKVDEVYSSLSLAQSDNGYVIEMEIYRLGYFQGTAAEANGMLVYTDDLVDMKGTIRFDSDHAVFEVTESTAGLAEVGTIWVFPEVKEA